LLSDFNPACVCLQETWIKTNTNIQFKNFSAYHCPGNVTDGIVYGGVAILVNNSFAHKSITLNTHLQAVAVRVSCHKTITVCSLYLPSSLRWTKEDLEELLSELPPPLILLGDFNAHGVSWGCFNNDSKGKIIQDFLLQHNLSLMNNGSMTYLSPASGLQSAIDLSICDPSLYLDFSWKTHSDLCGSDHFPVEITCDVTSLCQTNSSWKLTWNAFSNKANSQLSIESILDTDNPIGTFTNMLIDVANETIPKSKLRVVKNNTVWYNDECKNARKERKKALNLVKRQPTRSNLEHYRIIRAKTRRIMKSTKRQS